jgi:hypothetical protein
MSIWNAGVRRTGEQGQDAGAAGRPPDIQENAMRYLGYTLADPTIPLPPPTPELYAKMGELVAEATQAGVLLATGGVTAVEEATKVRYNDGEFTVLDGPFSEAKELVGGWALLEVRDRAEAIEWTKRFLAIAGQGETTLREVMGG